MSSSVETIQDVTEMLLTSYRQNTRRPSVVTGKGSHRQRRHMSPEWQKCCSLAGRYSQAVHGLFIACCSAEGRAANEVPIPLTVARLDAIENDLRSRGLETDNRMANWKVALRAIPPKSRNLILDKDLQSLLDRPRSPRKLNSAPGKFSTLVANLDAWTISACQPLETVFDERTPLKLETAKSMARYISCVATELLSIEAILPDIRLTDLVDRELFDLWLNAHDDHSASATLGTIRAFIRIRSDLHGRDDVVEHMQAQTTGRRDPHALPAGAVRELSVMLRRQRQIELLPIALMNLATLDIIPINTRLKIANIAPAMQAAMMYAMRPGDIFTLKHNGNYIPVIPTRLKKAAGTSLPESKMLIALLSQREQIRATLGAATSSTVMVNENGNAMGNKECAQALERTQDQFSLPKFPWQRLRDFTAVRILQANPEDLATVANLLEKKDPLLVHHRYAALLPRNRKAVISTDRKVQTNRWSKS